jgi:hypothetical protein
MGLLALFVPDSPIEELAEDDHQLKLSTNELLRKAGADEPAKQLPRSREAVTARLGVIPRALLSCAAIIGSALPGAIIFSSAAPALLVLHRRFFATVTLGSFASGTLARLGWAGPSGAGGTVVERLDSYVLRILYWLGTFAGTLALL